MKKGGLDDLHAATISCTKSRRHSLKMMFLLSMPVGLRPMRCAVDMSFGLTFKRTLSRSKFKMICLQSSRSVVTGTAGPDRIRASRRSYCSLASSFWFSDYFIIICLGNFTSGIQSLDHCDPRRLEQVAPA